MPKPYIYTEGESVGKYGATFIQENFSTNSRCRFCRAEIEN